MGIFTNNNDNDNGKGRHRCGHPRRPSTFCAEDWKEQRRFDEEDREEGGPGAIWGWGDH